MEYSTFLGQQKIKENFEKEKLGNKTHHKQVNMVYPVSFFKRKKLQNMDFTATLRDCIVPVKNCLGCGVSDIKA